MSSELKGIFALIFPQSTKLGTSQVLAGMQAHADQNHLDGVDYETVAGPLQSVSDTHQLPNSDTRSGPRQTFLTLGDAEAGESVASDDDWQGTLSDEDLGEQNAEDEQYGERLFALVARYMNKKGKGGKGAVRRVAAEGRARRGRSSNPRKSVNTTTGLATEKINATYCIPNSCRMIRKHHGKPLWQPGRSGRNTRR